MSTLLEHRRALTRAFAERLLAEEPRDVLDVGCGAGDLLVLLSAAGVTARGVEPDVAAAEAACARGLAVERGPGAPLELPDGSVDWVTLRHVPHHLERPREVFAEAWRVARTGVQLAEPWFDDRRAEQRTARALDRFLKRLERRRGRHHGDVLDANELLALLAAPGRVEVVRHPPMGMVRPEDLTRELDAIEALAPLEPAEGKELAALRVEVEAGRVGRNGSVLVLAWK